MALKRTAQGDPMNVSTSVRFRIWKDIDFSTLAMARSYDRPGEILYSGKDQDVTAWFEDALLEPLLALLENGEGIVRSSTSDLAFQLRPYKDRLALHATGDEENDPSGLVLSHDEAREIARIARIVLGAASG